MPIVRISGLLIYFAHVPKCAGTAVERYLTQRFGPLALRDPAFTLDAGPHWPRSSPQHVEAAALARMIPPGFLDGAFTVVRHPAARLRSLFLFQRDVEGTIPAAQTLADWLEELPRRWRADPWYLDNHPRPMAEIVPEGATVFRLEDGLGPVVAWLDELAGADDGPRRIETRGSYAQKLAQTGRAAGPAPDMTPGILDRIAEIYAADYARFGYAQDGQGNERAGMPDRASVE